MKKNNIIRNMEWKEKLIVLGVMDILTIYISYALALMLRFELSFAAIDKVYVEGFVDTIPIWCLATLVVFFVCHLYTPSIVISLMPVIPSL